MGEACSLPVFWPLAKLEEVMEVMGTSCTYAASAPDPTAGHCWPTPHQDTPGHSRASVAWSFVGSWLISPGSWCTQVCLCPPGVSLSPGLWKFCNQIPLTLKGRSPGDFQSLCWIPRSGSLFWDLELSQLCENRFGIIALRFVNRPPCGSMAVRPMVTSSERSYAHAAPPRTPARGPVPAAGHRWPSPAGEPSDTLRQVWLSLLWLNKYLLKPTMCLTLFWL